MSNFSTTQGCNTFFFEPPAIVAADFSSQNPEKVHCSSALARHLGLVAGVIMSDVWYWTSRNLARWDGWFYRSQEDWQRKTGLSEDSITRHLKRLEESGYVESRRGKHPEAVSAKQWVKFYRATQEFNRLYAEILTNEGFENKTAKCGSENGRKPQNADLNEKKTAKCGSENGRKPQNADQCGPEALQGQGFGFPQGSIDQGSIDQGKIPPTPQGETGQSSDEPGRDSKKPKRKDGYTPDLWVAAHNDYKPTAWPAVKTMDGKSRSAGVKAMIQAFGSESEALKAYTLVLTWIRTGSGDNPTWWRGKDITFENFVKTTAANVVSFYEKALNAGFTEAVPTASTPHLHPTGEDPSRLEEEIVAEHRRLYLPLGVIATESGCRRFGVTSIYDITKRPTEAIAYLAWLKSQPTPQDDSWAL